jgi:acyl carrier protein
MNKTTIEDRAICVLDERVGMEFEVTLDSTWDDLRFDSLDKIELIMAMEDEFHIDLPDDILRELTYVGEFINYLERVVRN